MCVGRGKTHCNLHIGRMGACATVGLPVGDPDIGIEVCQKLETGS